MRKQVPYRQLGSLHEVNALAGLAKAYYHTNMPHGIVNGRGIFKSIADGIKAAGDR